MRNLRFVILGWMGLGLMLWTTGCGNSKSSAGDAQVTSADSGEMAQRAETTPAVKAPGNSGVSGAALEKSRNAAAAPIPPPDVPEDAPVLVDAYPMLTDGALSQARLVDLPTGVVLQAEGVSITKADLEEEIAQMPSQMRQNEFFILEQIATRDLLAVLARQRVDGAADLNEEQLFQRYFEDLTSMVSVTDAEVKTFYDENGELVGNAPLEEMKPRIRQHLQQQKQQQLVERHIAELGTEITVAVSAEWVKEQAPQVLNNPVDKARGNGKPTFVNFGAQGCRPCDMMEPIREKLAKELKGHLDVVFVHVREQQMLASRYGVRGIPHLVFFDGNGDIVHIHTGFMPEEQIREWLKKSGVKDT